MIMRRDIARDVILARKTLISDIDGSDDYWNFIDNPTCENLIENPIYAMSSKGSVYSEIFGSTIYDTPIEGSMDMETWENPSMEEEHSKILYDHSDSYHVDPHKGINLKTLRSSVLERQM